MSKKHTFKQSFQRSAIISSVVGIVAYIIITHVNWKLLGFGFDGGPKPDTALEEAARIAAITQTVTIGGKTWMKKNLNVWTPNSWCYDDDPNNCNEYGRLYTWYAAKSACASLGDGWRLPTVYDWDALIDVAGGRETDGAKLKSQTGWPPFESGNWPNTITKIPICTDDFGFSALPGGKRYSETTRKHRDDIPRTHGVGYYRTVSRCGVWWTATESGSKAHCKRICYNIENDLYLPYKIDGHSVRCVKDSKEKGERP